MTRLDGIQLIQKIRNGKVKDGSKIKVFYDDGMFDESYVTVIEYKNNDIIWAPNTFKVSMLYDEYYSFEIIEDNDKLEKINVKTGDNCKRFIEYDDETGHHKYTIRLLDEYFSKNINKIIDHINKIEEELNDEK